MKHWANEGNYTSQKKRWDTNNFAIESIGVGECRISTAPWRADKATNLRGELVGQEPAGLVGQVQAHRSSGVAVGPRTDATRFDANDPGEKLRQKTDGWMDAYGCDGRRTTDGRMDANHGRMRFDAIDAAEDLWQTKAW